MIKAKYLLRFFLLLGFWLLMSGSADWQHILVGTIVAILVMWFWGSPATSQQKFHFKPILYALWLTGVMLAEIWKSAWHVAQIILLGRKIDPKLVWVDTPLQSRLARVVFSNCITLTPGTLTVSLEGNRLLVHALTPEFGKGLSDWKVHKILKKMEGQS